MKDTNIKSIEKFPANYRIFNENDILEIVYLNSTEYRQIDNSEQIIQRHFGSTDNTSLLLTAGSQYNLGDAGDWLEPSTPSMKSDTVFLYVMAFGIESDRNVQCEVKIASSALFGIKDQSTAYITPTISPLYEPTVTLYSIDTTFRPSFVLRNPSEYTLGSVVLGVKGFKYRLGPVIEKIPQYSTRINLNALTEG
jgi:hypothetical protein